MTPKLWWLLGAGLATSALGLVLLVIGLRGDPSRGRRRCPRCWYDLAGLALADPQTIVCPECGHTPARERAVYRRRRFRLEMGAGVVVLAIGLSAVGWTVGISGEWVAYVPTPVLHWMVRLDPPGINTGAGFPAGTTTRWTRARLAWAAAESLAADPRQTYWMSVYGDEARVAEARLASLLSSESPWLRERAVQAIGTLPRFRERFAARVGFLLINDPSREVRFACFNALHDQAQSPDRELVLMLVGALKEDNRDFRSYYALRLAMLPCGEGLEDVLLAPLRAARDGPGVWESAEKAIASYENGTAFRAAVRREPPPQRR